MSLQHLFGQQLFGQLTFPIKTESAVKRTLIKQEHDDNLVEKHNKHRGDRYEKFYDLLSWQISSQSFIGAFGATC